MVAMIYHQQPPRDPRVPPNTHVLASFRHDSSLVSPPPSHSLTFLILQLCREWVEMSAAPWLPGQSQSRTVLGGE